MRVLLGLGDCVSDAIVGTVKEFFDEMWRVCSGGHGSKGAGLG